MNASLVAAVVLMTVFAGGCSAAAPPRQTSSPFPATAPSSESSPGAVETSLSTIPSIVFADPVGIDQDPLAPPAIGSRPAPATYKPFLPAGHVVAVEWVQSLLNGKTQPLLTIRFDRYGSDVMASWTAAHLGDSMLVLVNGRYLTMPTVNEPLSDGSAQFTVADDAAVRRLLQSAPTEKP